METMAMRIRAQNLISSSSSSSSTSPTSARRPPFTVREEMLASAVVNLDSDIELSVDVSFFPRRTLVDSSRPFHDCEYAVILK